MLTVFARSFSALSIVGNTIADAHGDRYVQWKEEARYAIHNCLARDC